MKVINNNQFKVFVFSISDDSSTPISTEVQPGEIIEVDESNKDILRILDKIEEPSKEVKGKEGTKNADKK